MRIIESNGFFPIEEESPCYDGDLSERVHIHEDTKTHDVQLVLMSHPTKEIAHDTIFRMRNLHPDSTSRAQRNCQVPNTEQEMGET